MQAIWEIYLSGTLKMRVQVLKYNHLDADATHSKRMKRFDIKRVLDMNDFILKKATYYYYNMLSEREKKAYKVFLTAFLNMRSKAENFGTIANEQVSKIMRYVLNDRPDIFWVDRDYTVSSLDGIPVSVTFTYKYTEVQRQKLISDMENSRFYRQLDLKIKKAKTDFEKALAIYEYIIKNCEYETRALDNNLYNYAYGIEGVILKGRAVCSGYAKTFEYFANRHNIICTLVTGKTKRNYHAWNLINLHGDYYYIDSTWGDPTFQEGVIKDPDYISYDYFCVTTSELMESHSPVFDDQMPRCTATRYNYYEFFKLRDKFYSVENVAKRILMAVKSGKNQAAVIYSSYIEYKIAVERLFEKSEISEVMRLVRPYMANRQSVNLRYVLNERAKTITIKF